ncbi:thiamine biosynthesis lipoprotein [Maridesulfovibrio ferrireducens]|uniref:FAD:protein FMN transferase n=1 Tax=Maridesulfovibrio ferrireducens TaxID=246191 RepID=A0A1G9G6W4_9BACT|nr:MFS transporter [Maridesulfovibrio ferrireducens]SDK96376.1 thiamine biosynthesis lipoprotein [Maridesulfovibrio ferrireducens]
MLIHNSKRSQKLKQFQIPLLITATFIASVGIGIFTFTLPLLSLNEMAGGMWLGTAFSGYFLAKLLIAPLSGILSDRNGPKKILLISAGLAALLPLIYLISPSIESLYAIQFALGLCAGAIKTVGMAAVGAQTSGNKLTKRFSALVAGINTAFFLGPLIGGFLYIDRDFIPILTALSLCMMTSFLLFTLCEPSQSCVSRTTPQRKLIENKYTFGSTLLALFGRTIGIGGLIAFYPILIKSNLQLPAVTTGIIFSIPNLATILLLPLAGRFFSKTKREFIICSGLLLSAAGLYFLADCTAISEFIFAGIIIGTGSALSIPGSMALCSELSPQQGKTLGIANLITNLGFIAGPLLAGIIINFSGELTISFKLLALAGAALCLPLLNQALRVKFKRKSVLIVPSIALIFILFIIQTNLTQDFKQPSKQNSDQTLFRYTDIAMGTIVNLTLETPSAKKGEKAARNAIAKMRSLQKDFDHRNKRGSIGRINRAAGLKEISISEEALKLIDHGLKFSEKSNGTFDITVGAITTTQFYYALAPKTIQKRKPLIDYRLVEIDLDKGIVKLPHKGMALDLGGIAKGTIIDSAAKKLIEAGITTALVEAGGDFYGYGNRTWTIGIKNPREEGLLGNISIKNKAVCGSGDYYQFITTDSNRGESRRHHILDPSLMRSSHESIATTAIGPNAETADALATTIFIMGPIAGTRFIKRFYPECSAMWVMPDKSIHKTENFPQVTLTAKTVGPRKNK